MPPWHAERAVPYHTAILQVVPALAVVTSSATLTAVDCLALTLSIIRCGGRCVAVEGTPSSYLNLCLAAMNYDEQNNSHTALCSWCSVHGSCYETSILPLNTFVFARLPTRPVSITTVPSAHQLCSSRQAIPLTPAMAPQLLGGTRGIRQAISTVAGLHCTVQWLLLPSSSR